MEHNVILFGVCLKTVANELKNKGTDFAKVSYLNTVIKNSNIEKGIAHYLSDEKKCQRPPLVWVGVDCARYGFPYDQFKNEDEKAAYEFGVQSWNDYCQLKQWVSDIEKGKPVDFQLEEKEEEQPKATPEATPTKLTVILKKYYQNGCKPLNQQQVEKLAAEAGSSATKLYVNRWINLKKDNYQHNGTRQSAKEFLKAYDFLMKDFQNIDDNAFSHVKNHYEQLKETYPDLIY